MPNISTQLAQIIADVYASSSKSTSAVTYAKKASGQNSQVKQVANVGSATAATTQAVTYALSAAKIGANEIGKISMAASGLGLICAIPSAFEALSNLTNPGQGKSTKQMYKASKESLNRSLQSLKQNLLVTGAVKHDNAGRLLFNMPLDALRSKDNHDLYPYIKSNLVKQKRGDAIGFYKKWLTNPNKRAQLLQQFNQCLQSYDKADMPKPTISLGEVAAYLSLLDPEQDGDQIAALSQLFKEMLFTYRQTLAQDKDCASLLDESNRFLSNLMVTSYTGRAQRKKVDAKNLTIAKHVFTGVGVVLSAALAVHTVGLSIPVTALLAIKISSTTTSTVSTALEITKLVRNGSTAEEIAQLLSPDVLATLASDDMAQHLLDGEKAELTGFISQIKGLKEQLHQLQSSLYSDIVEIKSNPLFKLAEITNDSELAKVLNDQAFMSEMSQHIGKGMSAADLLMTMSQYIQTMPIRKPADITQRLAKTQLLSAVCELMVEDNQINRETLLATAKQGELAIYLRGRVGLEEKHIAKQVDAVNNLEAQAQKLGKLKQAAQQTLHEAQRTDKMLTHRTVGDSSIEKLLHASEYTEYLNKAKPRIQETLLKGMRQIEQIECKQDNLTSQFKASHLAMKQKLADQNPHLSQGQESQIQSPV